MKAKVIKKIVITGLFVFGFAISSFADGDCVYLGVTVGNGIAIPHPVDPTKYFLCVNGGGVDGQCPPGLIFREDLQTCAVPL